MACYIPRRVLIGLMLLPIITCDENGDCSDNCIQQANKLACDLVTKTCLYGCKDGFAGPDCSLECCTNCKTCTANESSTSVLCTECVEGFFLTGGVCMPCSRWCTDGTCRDGDGYCHSGCQEGYYGNTCTDRCSANCRDRICRSDNGVCTNGCSLSVIYGQYCSKACNEGCVNRECRQDGICLQGCTNTAWGPDCSKRCSSYCKDQFGQLQRDCNMTDGECLYGCLNDTYWGGNCSDDCNSKCKDQICDFKTGECTQGCTEGFTGPDCSKTKTDDDSGLKSWEIVGIIFGIVVIPVSILGCITCIIFNEKRKEKKAQMSPAS